MSRQFLVGVTIAAAALALGGCVSQQKFQAVQQQNTELEQEYQQLNQQMNEELAAKNMQLTRMQNAVKLTINSELLFPSGGWEMSERAKQSITKVAAILAPYQTTKISVNGYTDSTPIGPGLAREGITTNLALSQRRAETVMQFMIAQGVNPALVSAHGFGDANPVASNSTPEGRAQNRRVELTLASATQ